MSSTEVNAITRENQTPRDNEEIVRVVTILRDFCNLEQLPLCCGLPSDNDLNVKLDDLPIEFQAEVMEILEYGFQPFAMKDWMTIGILSEITGLDPNSLRDEKFRKSKFDFREPSSWGDILKFSGKYYTVWKEGKFARLHEIFFSKFLNKVLTEAENYLHHSFTRNHPKIRDYTREVIDFLDNKYDPEENHGRIVVDTSAITEIYATTQIAKLQAFLLYLTHNQTFEEARELVKNSTTLITKKGALGKSFDYLITIDRNKLGCPINENEPRFQIIYGEVKGVTEIVSKAKGSQGTYREIIVGSQNLNRIMTGEDFLIKISEIRYHLKDRYSQLSWDFNSIINLYKQISNDYASMVPVAQITKGRSRFKAMFNNRNSSRSPFHLFQMRQGNMQIKRVEYIELNELYSDPLDIPRVKIVPDYSKHIRNQFAVYFEGKNFDKQIVDPYSAIDSDKIKNMINQGFGKFSRRFLTYFGTSQNGKHTSKKCGFSGRLEGVKDDYLTVVYTVESILNSKSSVSYSSSHLKGNTHNNQWGKLGVNSMVAGKYADPEIAIKNGIIQFYQQLYDKDTTKATNFRRSRRTNWKKSIGILIKKGLLEEAQRYQNFANTVLSEFHAKITSQNTKIQRFRPINDR
ncbi:MAG: hypothetical protein HeimC2_05810 [Candidatus Heimdallarchaeota archaeon LC_2]|nr:MAG: hypothetical protein HeimC2_05810 [Candidatus Heimdallarchaeota archaeon LC_2]